MAKLHDIRLKKKFGQHFLRDHSVVEHMIDRVELSTEDSVFEIGGGDGFLTRTILEHPVSRLWVFEIDPEWVKHLRETIIDHRLTIIHQDIMTVDMAMFEPYKPWTLLANLPYQITMPFLQLLQQHSQLLKHGVIMIQEEVAQKIVAIRGKNMGFISLFFQYYFEWELLDKVPPQSFVPPPKVYSRLLYFKPKQTLKKIENEAGFWQFVRDCFKAPRRTLKNNLSGTRYLIKNLSEDILILRAQQLNFDELLQVWYKLL